MEAKEEIKEKEEQPEKKLDIMYVNKLADMEFRVMVIKDAQGP